MWNVILAFSLVPAEDLNNYRWFFSRLREAGLDLADTPIFCDRHQAFISAAEAFDLELRYRALHIMRNLLSHLPSSPNDTKPRVANPSSRNGRRVQQQTRMAGHRSWRGRASVH